MFYVMKYNQDLDQKSEKGFPQGERCEDILQVLDVNSKWLLRNHCSKNKT